MLDRTGSNAPIFKLRSLMPNFLLRGDFGRVPLFCQNCQKIARK